MLFGSTDVFAIEAMTETHLRAPSAVWGRMRVWCAGKEIGDFSEAHCGLGAAYQGFKALEQVLPSLWMAEFEHLDDAELWNLLDGELFGYHGDVALDDNRTVEECRDAWSRIGQFSFLTNWGEQFDRGGKSFIVCRPGGTVRILNRALSKPPDIACEAPLVQVISAIERFLAWFDLEAKRLSPGAALTS